MKVQPAVAIVSMVSVLSLSRPASAGVVEFEDEQRPDFFAAVGGEGNVSTVDFTGFEDFTPITDQWAHLGVHFSGFVVTTGFDDFLYPNDGWGARGEPDITVTFDEPINWVAADMPGSLNIELYKDDQLIYSSSNLSHGGTGNFGGLISDQPFDQARLFRDNVFLVAMDDLHFGPPIPTPGVGAPLVLTLFARRRRRRA